MHVNTYATEGDISMTLGQKICGFIEHYCLIPEGAQVGQPIKLKLFHDAKAPLANGHKRDSLLMMSDEEFESNHGFIQWAFPTAEKSDHNHLRISRAIDSLRLLHSWELADWLYGQVKAFAGQSMESMSDATVHWEAKASANHDRVACAFVGLD